MFLYSVYICAMKIGREAETHAVTELTIIITSFAGNLDIMKPILVEEGQPFDLEVPNHLIGLLF